MKHNTDILDVAPSSLTEAAKQDGLDQEQKMQRAMQVKEQAAQMNQHDNHNQRNHAQIQQPRKQN
jgi:hypothetical protein